MTDHQAAPRPHHILCSFHYFRDMNLGHLIREKFQFPVRVFGDSGAYSAMTQGKPIHPDEYVEWLKVNEPHLTCFANLDVIGDPEATLVNQRHIEARGFRPLPVFHTGEDWSYLDRYMAEYPYIALGGAVGYRAKALMPWLIQCYKRRRAAGLDGKVVFHGFGLTQMAVIMDLPWYSVDSSSWGQSYRYGALKLFDPTTGRFRTARLFNRPEIQAVATLIRTYGVDPSIFMERSRYHHRFAASVSVMAWRAMELYLRRRHGKVPFPGADAGAPGAGEPGPNVYQAVHPNDVTRDRGDAVWAALRGDGPNLFLADGSLGIHAMANRHIAGVETPESPTPPTQRST